jgi:hypothetical protein
MQNGTVECDKITGQWKEVQWDNTCSNEGVCTPGDTDNVSNGTNTCSEECTWNTICNEGYILEEGECKAIKTVCSETCPAGYRNENQYSEDAGGCCTAYTISFENYDTEFIISSPTSKYVKLCLDGVITRDNPLEVRYNEIERTPCKSRGRGPCVGVDACSGNQDNGLPCSCDYNPRGKQPCSNNAYRLFIDDGGRGIAEVTECRGERALPQNCRDTGSTVRDCTFYGQILCTYTDYSAGTMRIIGDMCTHNFDYCNSNAEISGRDWVEEHLRVGGQAQIAVCR